MVTYPINNIMWIEQFKQNLENIISAPGPWRRSRNSYVITATGTGMAPDPHHCD